MANNGFDVLALAAILEHLRKNPSGLSLDDLAQRIGADRSSTQRLVEYLWTVGIPDDDGFDSSIGMFDFDYDDFERDHIRLTYAPIESFSVRLSATERVTVQLGLEQLLRHADSAQRAQLLQLLERFKPTNTSTAAATAESDTELVRMIRHCLVSQLQLHLRYRSEDGNEVSERTVDPLRLEVRDRFTYLNAWCHTRNEPRWFRLDRVLYAMASDQPALQHTAAERDRPLEVSGQHLRAVDFAATEYGLHVLRPYLGSRMRRSELDDGRTRVTVRMRSLESVAKLVCEHAGELEVIAPAAVRQFVVDAASRALGK